jgi:hypothetical protein
MAKSPASRLAGHVFRPVHGASTFGASGFFPASLMHMFILPTHIAR